MILSQEARPFYLASSEDPVIAKIAGGCKPGSIFTTDLALGALMAAPRCINSWDMIVVRKGGHMYLDVREGSSLFDTTVIP
jgi:translation initiation factor 3 subunit D